MAKQNPISRHLPGAGFLLIVLASPSCQMVTFPSTHPAIGTDADAFAIGLQNEAQVAHGNWWMVSNLYGGETSGDSAVESSGLNFAGTGLALRNYIFGKNNGFGDFDQTTKFQPFLFAGADTLWVDGPPRDETEASWGHNSYWDAAVLFGYGCKIETVVAGSAVAVEVSAGQRTPFWGKLDDHDNFEDYDASGFFLNFGISF